jgi:protein gp37
MGDSNISWTDKGWSPIVGCSRVSAGCMNCYAETLVGHRLSTNPVFAGSGMYQGLTRPTNDGPRWTGEIEFFPERLYAPFVWREPQRVFVNPQSDLFHDNVPLELMQVIFGVMAITPRHTYQVLTKRPKRMQQVLSDPSFQAGMVSAMQALAFEQKYETMFWLMAERLSQMQAKLSWPLPNVWLGVSVEDQGTASERIPLLQATPAAKRFISAEPLIGEINILQATDTWKGLSWIIVGGEAAPANKRRPMEQSWALDLYRQSKSAGVPFFYKQDAAPRPGTRPYFVNDKGERVYVQRFPV